MKKIILKKYFNFFFFFLLNRAAEAELTSPQSSAGANQEWDRVSKLCDFNPKANKNTKDVSRMRSILLQLKQQPLIRSAN